MKRTVDIVQLMNLNPAGSVWEMIAVSPDFKRIAQVCRKDEKLYVQCDDVMDREFDRFLPPLIFSPNGQHFAYNFVEDRRVFTMINHQEFGPFDDVTEGGPFFSPDSQHVAFGYSINGDWFYLLNGVKQGPFKGVGQGVFSPDSQQLGYKAVQFSGERQCIVINGSEERAFDHVDNPRFSPDSSHIAYASREGDRWCAVLDGQPGDYFDETHVKPDPFSPDSKHFGYVVIGKNTWSVVIDDAVHGPYDGLSAPGFVFSPDSKTVAWSYEKDKDNFIYMDGDTLGPFNDAGQITFSPNGRRYSFIKKMKKKKKKFGIFQAYDFYMVLDGEESRPYQEVMFGVFSPDSQRFAFCAGKDGMCFPVIDGVEGPLHKNIGPVMFSPDSRNSAHVADEAKKYKIVLEDTAYGPFDKVFGHEFSPDNRYFVFEEMSSNGASINIDGTPGERFEVIIPRDEKVLAFTSPNQIHYFGVRDSMIMQVSEIIA